MKMKPQTTLFKRLTAGALSAVLALGAFAAVPLLPDSPVMMTAQAATTEDGQFDYSVNDGKVTIDKYKGGDENVTIPSIIDGQPVTAIGDYAFAFCDSLSSVTIPGCVTSIGSSAFSYCTSLASVTIPSSVTSIGTRTFYQCTSLASIQVSSSNQYFSSQNGVLFNKQKTELLTCPCAKSGAYTIPDSVTIIGEEAFSLCEGLTAVTIPSHVTTIGAFAFYCCKGLSFISFPDSLTTIGEFAFCYCTNLSFVNIPSSVSTIEKDAFYSCKSLSSVTIPGSVTTISHAMFAYCFGLTSVTIQNGVTTICEDAFSYCKSLSSVTIPDSVTVIEKYAFDDSPDVTFYANSGSYAETYAEENDIPFVSLPFQNTSTLSKTTVPKLNGVTVKGRSVQGKGTVTYAFYYKKMDSKGWTSVGTKYDGTTEATIFPNRPAVYQIMVKAKDKTGRISSKIMTLAVTVPTKDDLVNRSYSPNTTVKKGAAVSVNGKASGGAGRYTYAYYYRKASGKAFTSIGTPFVNQTKAWFRPASAGEYVVRVLAKDIEGTVALKEYKVTVTK